MPKQLLLLMLAILTVFTGLEDLALAAQQQIMMGQSRSQQPTYSSDKGSSGQEMLLDVSALYVRDTRTNGSSDTGTHVSLGGMFNSWIGLDLQGLLELRSQNYLVGSDLRIAPVDWFFLKGGIGGYSNKNTHQLALTPLTSAGIMARIDHQFYFTAETSYFQVSTSDNVAFGAGLGVSF